MSYKPEGAGGQRRRLYHFTCPDHGRRGIGKRGALLPNRHPQLGIYVVWMTADPSPDRQSTGLGQTFTTCDRMAYRYSVLNTDLCEPWLTSAARRSAPTAIVADLERFGDPENWWIASQPVMARLG